MATESEEAAANLLAQHRHGTHSAAHMPGWGWHEATLIALDEARRVSTPVGPRNAALSGTAVAIILGGEPAFDNAADKAAFAASVRATARALCPGHIHGAATQLRSDKRPPWIKVVFHDTPAALSSKLGLAAAARLAVTFADTTIHLPLRLVPGDAPPGAVELKAVGPASPTMLHSGFFRSLLHCAGYKDIVCSPTFAPVYQGGDVEDLDLGRIFAYVTPPANDPDLKNLPRSLKYNAGYNDVRIYVGRSLSDDDEAMEGTAAATPAPAESPHVNVDSPQTSSEHAATGDAEQPSLPTPAHPPTMVGVSVPPPPTIPTTASSMPPPPPPRRNPPAAAHPLSNLTGPPPPPPPRSHAPTPPPPPPSQRPLPPPAAPGGDKSSGQDGGLGGNTGQTGGGGRSGSKAGNDTDDGGGHGDAGGVDNGGNKDGSGGRKDCTRSSDNRSGGESSGQRDSSGQGGGRGKGGGRGHGSGRGGNSGGQSGSGGSGGSGGRGGRGGKGDGSGHDGTGGPQHKPLRRSAKRLNNKDAAQEGDGHPFTEALMLWAQDNLPTVPINALRASCALLRQSHEQWWVATAPAITRDVTSAFLSSLRMAHPAAAAAVDVNEEAYGPLSSRASSVDMSDIPLSGLSMQDQGQDSRHQSPQRGRRRLRSPASTSTSTSPTARRLPRAAHDPNRPKYWSGASQSTALPVPPSQSSSAPSQQGTLAKPGRSTR